MGAVRARVADLLGDPAVLAEEPPPVSRSGAGGLTPHAGGFTPSFTTPASAGRGPRSDPAAEPNSPFTDLDGNPWTPFGENENRV